MEFLIKHEYQIDEQTNTLNSRIYKAKDLSLGRNVCIKEVKIAGKGQEKKSNLKKAMTEVSAMVNSKISNIPKIYFTHTDKDKLYIIMEWIEGYSLRDYLERKKKPTEWEFIGWMVSLCQTLKELEKVKIHHKDIKPENIIIKNNELYLLDFNISMSLPNKYEGTPFYRAPEMETSFSVARNRVDIFSIGVMLYEYYTGVIPKRGQEYQEGSIRIRRDDWETFTSPQNYNQNISETIENIIFTCMKKNPKNRYTVSKLYELLKNYKRKLRKR